MVNITAALVKELRERTGVGMMECKKALTEAQGNIELAIDNMRKSGQAKAAKKAARIAAEGNIVIKIAKNGKYGVIIELNCETDFVAQDENFKIFGQEIAITALHEHISNIEMLKTKFEDRRVALVSKIGENINIRRIGVLGGTTLGSYLHGIRIGVIASSSNADKRLLQQIAMHIAASKPEYVNMEDIPAHVLARERQIQMDIAIQSGKSHEISKRIVEGRMRKFASEISLLDQPFIMDMSKTVSQLLIECHASVNSFIRFEVGEGIEKMGADSIVKISTIMQQS